MDVCMGDAIICYGLMSTVFPHIGVSNQNRCCPIVNYVLHGIQLIFHHFYCSNSN